MEPKQSDPISVDPNTEGEEASSSPYTWPTILMGLLLALSLLGSIVWRAFPPSTFLGEKGQPSGRSNHAGLPVSVSVAATAGWVETGVTLDPNTSYLLSALGQIQLGRLAGFNQSVDPQGFEGECRNQTGGSCSLGDAPSGALVGRIGPTNPFLIGDVMLLKTGAGGPLWLAVNDRLDSYSDNQGLFTVRIEYFGGNQFDSAKDLPGAPLIVSIEPIHLLDKFAFNNLRRDALWN